MDHEYLANNTKFMPKEQYDFMHKKPIMVTESMTCMETFEVFLFLNNLHFLASQDMSSIPVEHSYIVPTGQTYYPPGQQHMYPVGQYGHDIYG